MTRIAQLANFYSPVSGGLRIAVDALAAGYRANGHHVRLVIPGPISQIRPDRTVIASPPLPHSGGYRVIVSGRAVRAALTAFAPDVIEVHDKLLLHFVWRWARDHDVPVITASHERFDRTFDDLLPRVPSSARARAARRLASGVLEHSDVVVAYSRFAAAEFPPSAKVRLATLGVDLDTFRPLRPPPTDGPINLLCVTRLSPEKRPDLAVDTVAELIRRGYRAGLTIIGSGPWESTVRERAKNLPVRFRGFVEQREVARALAQAEIVLAPGPAETFGLAALEALACGAAVVAVAGSGAAERIVGHPAAGRVAPADGGEMASAVCALLEVPADVRRSAARRLAEDYDWKRAVEAMLDLHDEQLRGRGVSSPSRRKVPA